MTTTERAGPTKTSMDALSAIYRYRHQRRLGRVWLVGDKRIAATTVAVLEQKAFVREVAIGGTPILVLTNEGKQLVANRQL